MDKVDLQQAVHATELALAQARLLLAETEARTQTLEQQNHALRAELDDERARRAPPASSSSGGSSNPLNWFKRKQ